MNYKLINPIIKILKSIKRTGINASIILTSSESKFTLQVIKGIKDSYFGAFIKYFSVRYLLIHEIFVRDKKS
ncbi:10928_t:CDS:2 [Gigaspora margarita]|uniref:10928_t:CDS:1 n=1 Tax=Gigaspora margarita TaxID=4874 RepID=A0ABN7UCT1_GIGMA|nr:10928_t:CDS:2 [Gigaspora margarita]